MKIHLFADEVKSVLTFLKKIVPTRTPKPILECIKISAKDDMVTFSCTDLETYCIYPLSKAEVREEGSVCIKLAFLSQLVRQSSPDVLTISSFEKDDTIFVETQLAGLTTKSEAFDAAEFPIVETSTKDSRASISIPTEELVQTLKQTHISVGRVNSYYAISGILWNFENENCVIASTDGHRLSKTVLSVSASVSNDEKKLGIIAPLRFSECLLSLSQNKRKKEKKSKNRYSPFIKNDSNLVKVQVVEDELKDVDNILVAQVDGIILYTREIEGNFPKYDDVIPKGLAQSVQVNKEAFEYAINQVDSIKMEDEYGINLAFKINQEIEISRTCGENVVAKSIPAEVVIKNDISRNFNARFLLEFAKIIQDENIIIEINDIVKNGILGPNVFRGEFDSNFTYVLMPI